MLASFLGVFPILTPLASLVLKGKEILTIRYKWVKLEDIEISKIRQAQEDTIWILPFIRGL
jgi:hypothetical protein